MLHQFRTIGGFGIYGNNCSIEGLVALLFLQRNSRSWTWKTFTNKGMHIIVMSIENVYFTIHIHYVLFKHIIHMHIVYLKRYMRRHMYDIELTSRRRVYLSWKRVKGWNALYIWQINVFRKLSNVNNIKSERPSLIYIYDMFIFIYLSIYLWLQI